MIPDEAVEAAARQLAEHAGFGFDAEFYRADATAALEAASPHLITNWREETRLAHLDAVVNARTADQLETKLAAIIVALDPFERSTSWKATSDEAGCPAFDAVLKIRAILDATP